MDPALESLWRVGQKPFHDKTIFSGDGHTVADALISIESAIRHIELYYPSAELRQFDDWHEHDGMVFDSSPVSLEDLREQTSSAEAFIKNHSDDYAVYRAVYPASLDFLLRYCLWDADVPNQPEHARSADWSFTGYGFDLMEIKKRWGRAQLIEEPSKSYFTQRYGG
ncbi:hypothetical protein HNR46_002065 [Haloferula luteola]|uniref:Uncharacterized protein n=1 Tax=Haloferula luteola TaxID=595692 RepID=A0A840V443_9BACT|nr:hypothetical protein [Haloferula luteola]MBB5351826.1 hypothetical protein [Haloferula luteola]